MSTTLAQALRSCLLALGLAALSLWAHPACAQEEDDPHDTTKAMTAGVAQVLARDLAVLQERTDAASEACVTALKDLHKTQDEIADEEKRTKYQDLPVARDVLDSNFEDASQYCGADARRVCRTQGGTDAHLSAPCADLRKHQDDDAQ